MIKCPKCGNEVDNSAKFCGACGESLEEIKKTNNLKIIKVIKVFILVIVIIFSIIACILYSNYNYEQKNLKPLLFDAISHDTNLKYACSYDKKSKIINIDLKTDQKIEQWQIDEIGKEKPAVDLRYIIDGIEKKVPYNTIHLTPGDFLELNYKINNSTLEDFIKTKKAMIDSSPKFSINQNLHFDSEYRLYLKNKYLIEQKRKEKSKREMKERARRIREISNQLYLNNQYYNGYYGY